jgi:hypothetical protein
MCRGKINSLKLVVISCILLVSLIGHSTFFRWSDIRLKLQIRNLNITSGFLPTNKTAFSRIYDFSLSNIQVEEIFFE